MNNEKTIAIIVTTSEEPPALVKKIGKTTYVVKVHFSETSHETMQDKISRMLKNEVRHTTSDAI